MHKKNITQETKFYKNFQQINPSLILGLIIITFGLYIINWLYLRNKDFEQLDKNAPDSSRGAILLMIFPFAWFFITEVFKKLIFRNENLFIEIIEIVGWGIILLLILKYLLDFCLSFGRITKTQGIFWFLLFIIGICGLISIPFGFYYTIPLSFFLIVSIPAMQAEMNSYFTKFSIRKSKNIFYQ